MADAATIDYIDPASIDLIAYYVDGNYVPSRQALDRFAGKVHVPISVNLSGNAGIVLDGPPDNGSVSEVPGWVDRAWRRGVTPTVYTDRSMWAEIVQAINNAGVRQPLWWIAQWNGDASMIPGAIAHQYETVANRYDLSVVADYWPGIDPAPTSPGAPSRGGGGGGTTTQKPSPPPGPTPQQIEAEDKVLLVSTPQGIYVLSGSLYAPVATPDDVHSMEAAGVGHADIGAGTHDNLKAAASALQGKLSGSLNISGALQAT